MLPFYDICRRRPQMSEQKGKSVKNKELIKEKIIFYMVLYFLFLPGYKYVKVDQKMQEDNQEASKDLQTDVTDQRVRLEDVMGVITTELEKLITTQ